MDDEKIIQIDEVKMKRLRNLKMFKGKTDEDIYEFYRNRDPQAVKPPRRPKAPQDQSTLDDAAYDKLFQEKLGDFQSEYSVDMNNSNDVEQLKSLVRFIIQQEIVNKQIIRLQRAEDVDPRVLKNLGDYQRTLNQSINDVQDKLSITRKQRKDKAEDSDVPTFIADLKSRAKEFFDKKTVEVKCEKCGVELARYWLNFPDNTKLVHYEGTCWKCGEERIYTS